MSASDASGWRRYNIFISSTFKDKVRRLFGALGGEDDRCTPYRLAWRDGHFEGEDFERIVTEQLALQIELETAREEEAGAASWWVQEKELEESTLRLLAGYRAAPKCERSDRSRFKELKNKDRLIVQNIPYIMNGEEIVRI